MISPVRVLSVPESYLVGERACLHSADQALSSLPDAETHGRPDPGYPAFSDALGEHIHAGGPEAVQSFGKIPLIAVRLDIPMDDRVLVRDHPRRIAQ